MIRWTTMPLQGYHGVAKEDDVHSDEEDERGRAGVEAIVGSGEAWVSL